MSSLKAKKRVIAAAMIVIMTMAIAIPGSSIFAVNAVDVGRKCSLQLQVGNDWSELKKADITVDLYRVADITEKGKFIALADYADMDFSGVGKDAKAELWTELAKVAEADVQKGLKKDASFQVSGGKGSLDDLSTGLYLVWCEEVDTELFSYTFTPYLVSLPNIEVGGSSWVYDNVSISLKPEQKELSGELEIEKTLVSYNQSMGSATVVFDVEAQKGGVNVYSNVLTMNFTEPGKKTILVKNLPVGAEVTVTEIYTGASYKVTSDGVQKVTIRAGEGPAKVSFTNDYDERLTYGTSVVNHFEADENGHFKWEQLNESKQEG